MLGTYVYFTSLLREICLQIYTSNTNCSVKSILGINYTRSLLKENTYYGVVQWNKTNTISKFLIIFRNNKILCIDRSVYKLKAFKRIKVQIIKSISKNEYFFLLFYISVICKFHLLSSCLLNGNSWQFSVLSIHYNVDFWKYLILR